MPPVTDPVCGMTVESTTAFARSEWEGRTYYFCSEACQREFAADPSRYTAEVRVDERVTPAADTKPERDEPRFTKSGGFVAPKFGSAGSGGLEYEGPPKKRDDEAR